MRSTLAALILLPAIALSQFSGRFSYSQGDPTYRWVNSSESVDLAVMYATSDQWRFGVNLAWQYLVLNARETNGGQGIMTPLTIVARYYTSESGLRGYFEGSAGVVRRYYHSLVYSKFDPSAEYTLIGWDATIHYAPQYGVGLGFAVPVVADLDLNLGLQIDVSPKGFQRSNIDGDLRDGFSQTRALIAFDYRF